MREVDRFIDLCASDPHTREVLLVKQAGKHELISLYLYLREHLRRENQESHAILFRCFYNPSILSFALELFDGEKMRNAEGEERPALLLFEDYVRRSLELRSDQRLIKDP